MEWIITIVNNDFIATISQVKRLQSKTSVAVRGNIALNGRVDQPRTVGVTSVDAISCVIIESTRWNDNGLAWTETARIDNCVHEIRTSIIYEWESVPDHWR